MSPKLEALYEREQALRREAQYVSDQITRALIEDAGVAVGDIVVWCGSEYKVSSLDVRGRRVVFYGNRRKKDGGWMGHVSFIDGAIERVGPQLATT